MENVTNRQLYHQNKYMCERLVTMRIGGGNSIHDSNKMGFYFVHHVMKKDNLINILKDGQVKLVKDIPIEDRSLSGPDELDYLYMNIQFEDLNNLIAIENNTLLFDPKLAYDKNWIFNKYWSKYPNLDSIFIYEDDDIDKKNHNIAKIKEYVKNPTHYQGTPLGKIIDSTQLGKMSHEVLFTESIPLDKYLIGIILDTTDDDELESLIVKYKNGNIS